MPRSHSVVLIVIAGVVCASIATARVQSPAPYRVVTTDGTQTLAVQSTVGAADIVSLDALARLFGWTVREDSRVGGVVVVSGNDRVVLTAGQATVSTGGRLLSLSAPVTRTDGAWLVPVDFLRTLGRGVEVRRGSRLIVVPPAVVPNITPRFERTATGGRLVLSVDPAATSRVTRDGSVVTVRFQANSLDLETLTGAPADLVARLRSDGPTLVIDLGAAVTNVRSEEGRDPGRVAIELVSATPAAATTPAPLPPLDRTAGIRTVVLDPGHGGDDNGTHSQSGVIEKHVTLAVAQRVKALLESRLGVRVVLTREGDQTVTADRRAAIANNNKADLFISLHANGSPAPNARGVQVLSLDMVDYSRLDGAAPRSDAPALPVPLAGGGTRVIDTVPWQLAQLPHVAASATWAEMTAKRIAGTGVTMHPHAVDVAALRVLVGANMPAILIELGYLTNADDANALADGAHIAALAEAIAAAVSDVRFGIPAAPRGQTP